MRMNSHERHLLVIYIYLKTFFRKDNFFTVHDVIQSLAIEMFKFSNNITPTILMSYLQDLIIVIIFAQNLSFLFQVFRT